MVFLLVFSDILDAWSETAADSPGVDLRQELFDFPDLLRKRNLFHSDADSMQKNFLIIAIIKNRGRGLFLTALSRNFLSAAGGFR